MQTFTASVLLVGILSAGADAWPAFRGTGNSVSPAQHVPTEWSEQSGVAWNVELTGYGQSSPIVWQDRVFVTSADGLGMKRARDSI